MIGYKLFRTKRSEPGKLFPLYVLADKETVIGEWIAADSGPLVDGKVASKLGKLCYRPGWHLSDIPLATHIGIKEDGVIKYMHYDEVWCECEYSDEVDYQALATQNGYENGKFNPKNAMLKEIPRDGFYRYKTNPLMLGNWIIAGEIKVNKILTDRSVERICEAHGYTALPRKAPFNWSVFNPEHLA